MVVKIGEGGANGGQVFTVIQLQHYAVSTISITGLVSSLAL